MYKEDIYKKFRIIITGEKIIPLLAADPLKVFVSKVSSITNIEKNEKIDLQGLHEHNGKIIEESMNKALQEAKNWIESNIKLNPNLLYPGNKGWVQIISSDLDKYINQWINEGISSKDILYVVKRVAEYRGDKNLIKKTKEDKKL
jgi:hypothetical protein